MLGSESGGAERHDMRLGPAIGAAALLVTATAGAPDATAGPEDPRKPPAIATAEVPAIPAALFARLAPYRNVRAASFAGWAPAGDEMLVATRLGETTQLHRVR